MSFALSPLSLLLGFLIGTLSAYMAHKRGRNPYGWFLIGFLFGMIGMIFIFFFPPHKNRKAEPSQEPVLPQVVGPADKFWYYLDREHAQQGPMSLHALTRAFREGKISQSTFVWYEDLSEWKPLEAFLRPPQKMQS